MEFQEKKYSIIGISDVSLGYGSPQIIALMRSLADYYKSQALIIEPDQVNRKPYAGVIERCDVRRASQTTDPHTTAGRQEYIIQASRLINRLRPQMLVVFCTYSLPVIYKLKYKPAFILYSSLESVEAYGSFDVELNRYAAANIDAIIFPEENRARLDSARCGFLDIPSVILYNAANSKDVDHIAPPHQRNKRIIYSGTIDRRRTMADFFLEESAQSLPLDILGHFSGDGKDDLRDALITRDSNIRYKGQVEAYRLSDIRRHYAFSLVMWSPDNENQRYACPNKFFDAIADGVPPITTPHPQAEMLVHRYQCGIVMPDWTYNGFLSSIKQGLSILGMERYKNMVDNCKKAVIQELNWEHQFNMLKRLLPQNLWD